MKKLLLSLAMLLFAVPLCATTPVYLPIGVSANGRYFVDGHGKPFIIQADAGHHIVPAIPQTSWAAYMSDRVADGFNTVDLYMMCGGSSGTCPSSAAANDGTLPFTSGSAGSYDFSTPNSAYWSEVDTLVSDAEAAGLVIICDPMPWGNNFSANMQSQGSTKVFNFGAFIGNRYKNYPNIIWMLGDDFDGSSFPSNANIALMGQLAAGIKSADTNHILTTQLNYNYSYTLQAKGIDSSFDTSNNFDLLYDYEELYAGTYAAYNATPAQPIWMGEANYETANNTGGLSGNTNAFITRMQSWWVMTSGGSGYEFGNEHINHFDSGYNSTSGPCSPQSCLDTTATLQQQYILQLFYRFAWQNFAPDQTHQVVTAGYGTANGTNLNLFAANYATTTWDGSTTAIVYAPVSTTLTVNLAKFSAPVNAYWFDPTAGTYATISGSPFTNSGTHGFASPSAHSDSTDDYVLVLAPASLGGAGACPSTVPSGVTQCYFSATYGADTNSGLSEQYPWLYSPGMNSCASACATEKGVVTSGSGAAGVGVILRGGDTWHFGNSSATPYAGIVSACTNNGNTAVGLCFADVYLASSGSPFYVGVDQGWYTGSSWARPILTADNSICNVTTIGVMPDGATCSNGTDPTGNSQPTYIVSSCPYQVGANNLLVSVGNSKYVYLDNLELTGLCSKIVGQPAGDDTYVTIGGDQGPSTFTNLYIHGSSHLQYAFYNSSSGCTATVFCFNMYAFDGRVTVGSVGNTLQNNVIDFADSDPAGTGLCYPNTDLYNFAYNVVRYNSQCIPTDVKTVHDNLFEYYYENGHSNLWEDSETAPIGVLYNNIFRHMFGALVLWPGPNASNSSSYFFNNLGYDVTTSQYFDYGGLGLGNNLGSYFFFNNTLQSNSNHSAIISGCASTNNAFANTNNHYIDDATPYPSSCTGMTNTSPLSMSNSTATTDGYTSAQTFAYSPTSGGSPTVTMGTNEYSGYCSTLLASGDSLIQAAGTACQSGTSYACVYDSSLHTISCPGQTPNARPISSAWDIGAYQFMAGSSGPSAPTNIIVTPGRVRKYVWNLDEILNGRF